MKVEKLASIIDMNKWRAVIYGVFSFSIVEREKYWTYEDDIDFEIACELKRLLNASS